MSLPETPTDRAPSGAHGQASRTWLQILTNWRSRINRVQLLAGMALLLVGSVPVFLIDLALFIADASGPISLLGEVFMFVGMIPVSALIAQRAHDIGQSAYLPLGAFGLAATTQGLWALAFYDVVDGIFDGRLAGWISHLGLAEEMFWVPFGCTAVAVLLTQPLFVIPGQKGPNRFGPPPSGNDIRLA